MAEVNLYSERKIPRRMFPISDWQEGIADFNKKGGSYLWSRGVDYRTEPSQLTLLPSAILEASAPFVDLGKWATTVIGRTVPIGNINVPVINNSFEISQSNALVYRGVNMSGLEDGVNFVATLGSGYFNSSQDTYNYMAGKKMAVIRLPFLWEHAQPTLGGGLDPTYMDILDAEIVKIGNAGMKVILDCHNYGRRLILTDGGITENFTASTPSLQYPYADYNQDGHIVLRDYGEAFLGTVNNPVSPAVGCKVSFNMKFNSKDHSFGGEGLYVRPMWVSDEQCYEFGADLADGTWELSTYIGGVQTVLASGSRAWGTSATYAIVVDVNETTNGFVNVSVNGTPLFTTNSIASTPALNKGLVGFFPAGVHVQIDTLVLQINGSTSGGGINQYIIGSTQVPYSALASFWALIAGRYYHNNTVLGYDLMNEAHDMIVPTTSSNYNTTASVTLMDQACINAIRAIDTAHYIIAEIDHWAGGQNFTPDYGVDPTPWLTDPTGLLVYSFHYYFDDDHSGTYQQSFNSDNNADIPEDVTDIMEWAQDNNLLLFCGEYGVPAISAWQPCLTTFLDLCNTYNVWATYWAAGDAYTAVTSIQPSGTVGAYVDALQMTIVGNITYLVPASVTGSGWTLGSDYVFLPGGAYDGNWTVKQTSVGGSSALTTASGSPIAVLQYSDYELTFYVNVSITAGLGPSIQVLGGSLSGPNLVTTPVQITDTDSLWQPISVHFNALQYTQVFIKIANQNGNVVANYDYFILQQINSIASYALGDKGNFYIRYSDASWKLLATFPNNHGNGLGYYGEDDYLYIIGDYTVGRYGPLSSQVPTLVFDYLTSAGGVPTNVASPLLVAANSNYFNLAAGSTTVINAITGDIALEAFIKPSTLPAIGSSMTIMGVWKESSNQRAWKLDLFGVSGFFGNAQDSSLTLSTNTVQPQFNSVTSGTVGQNTLNANNSNFAVGQKILIIQMQGAGAGNKQVTTIQGYDNTAQVITTQDPLNFSYNSGSNNAAQVIVIPQYSNVTLGANVIWSPPPWNGQVGGVLVANINGTLLFNLGSAIVGDALGFRGGLTPVFFQGSSGEGTTGPQVNAPANQTYEAFAVSATNNGSGGEGGATDANTKNTPAAGGSNGTQGGYGIIAAGALGSPVFNSVPGILSGSANLATAVPGSGGGGGDFVSGGSGQAKGGTGGALIYLSAAAIAGAGSITSNGGVGITAGGRHTGSAGGAGGSILVNTQQGNFASILLQAIGGIGSYGNGTTGAGQNLVASKAGDGGDGIIAVNYLLSYTIGTADPTPFITQQSTLVTTPTTQIRLGISNDGTSFEYLVQNLKNVAVASWDRIQVSWDSAHSKAYFYEGGNPIGTAVGAKTAIFGSSAADFAFGGNVVVSTTYTNFADMEINDARIWNQQVTQAQFTAYNFVNLNGAAPGLVGNWFTTASPNDEASNANNVAPQGSPAIVYLADVPYAGATTRGDIDQTNPIGGTSSTCAIPTVFTEADKTSFVPAQDPQKSIAVTLGATGNGNLTMVVHNGLNQLVASVTVPNANLVVGVNEFIFTQVYHPVVGATYHFHLYQGGTGATVKTATSSDFTKIAYTTYYQFLVTDYEYHPVMQVENVLAIGNGRYVAVIDASGGALSANIGTYNLQGYNPRRLVLPAGWRVRCFAQWLGNLVIGCWRGNNIKDFDQGMVFIWDGHSVTYNDYFFVAEGGVNAMWGENDILYIAAGYHGDVLEYTGASKTNLKVKRIPRIGNANYTEVTPGGMGFWNGLLRINYSYNSDSPIHEKGIYTWGTTNLKYAKSLSYDYPIPTGNRFTTVRSGAILPVGGNLLMFYQDGVSYGVGRINPSNPPQTTGTLEELVTDFGFVWKEKNEQTVRADHLPLTMGANVDVKYKINYEDNWHNQGIDKQVAGAQITRLPLDVGQENNYHILQIAVDLYATQGVGPVIVEHSQFTDLNLTQTDDHAVNTDQVYE